MIAFRMPSLGADMDAGTLVEWYRGPGDVVRRGDIIAVVETQKGAIEIEVFHDGTMGRTLVAPGDKVAVGAVIAEIMEPGEPSAAAAAPASGTTVAAGPEPLPPAAKPEARPVPAARPRPIASASGPSAETVERLAVTPAARRQAIEAGIDLTAVAPGPHGIIGLEQLAALRARQPVRRATRAGLDPDEMRKAIAAAMTRSHRDIPHYWVSRIVDVTPLFDWLADRNAQRPVTERLLYAAPLVAAVGRALKDAPGLNGHMTADGFRPAETVHLGIGTALRGGGLVAPALHDADTLGVDAIMAGLADLVPRARQGRLRSSEFTDATATLSSLGEGSSDQLMPLIYPPQVAIVGCGGPVERPFVVRGVVAVRKVMTVTLGGDHRVSDGRLADRFLARLDSLLQEPQSL